jgi:cbb3-type cytochrome oxidase subunit 3
MDEVPGGMNVLGFTLFDQTVTEAGFTTENALLLDNIGTYIFIVLNLLGVVLLLIFLYAGFLWMTAQGDSKQVDKAKMMMRNALIGLVITLLSRAMATFVIDRLVAAGVAHLPEAIHSTIVT